MYDLLGTFSVVAPIAFSIAGAIYTFFASRSKANDQRLDEITKRLDQVELGITAAGHSAAALASIDKSLIDHDRRIQSMEGELKHLPDKDAVNELKLAISDLNGTVKAMDAQLGGLSRSVNNIDGYLRRDDAK